MADAIDQYGVNAVLCVYGWLLIIFCCFAVHAPFLILCLVALLSKAIDQSCGCWNENQLTGYQYWIFTQGQTTLRYRAGVIDQGNIECDLL